MTAQEIVPYLLAANLLMSICAIVYSWFSSSGKEALKGLSALEDVLQKQHDKLESDMGNTVALLNARCGLLEQNGAVLSSTIEHLPSNNTTHRLELAIARVEGRLETLTERLQPVAHVAARLQERAMDRG